MRISSVFAVVLSTIVLAAGGFVALVVTPPAAQAADLRYFQAGNIVSDQVFYDASTMSIADIQAFLDSRGSRCVGGNDGTPCLRVYRGASVARPADAKCPGGYAASGNESAAEIVYKVSQACGVNPRALLVLLQKEQGLITASGSSLTAGRYRAAMGYGCPDTAPCDALYYGFANQVYSAAAQFRNYRNNPGRFGYQAGRTVNVLYNPDAACGSSPVYIQNQATAGLYNYTPYQPNAAALAAGYGSGDSCSAYGNRNFYSYFTDWFGSTGTNAGPFGVVDSFQPQQDSVRVAGWAMDPDTNDPIDVHVYVDSVGTPTTANLYRPDVAGYGKGALHGFDVTVPASPGTHQVCAFAINVPAGINPPFGCRTLTVIGNRAPIGSVDAFSVAADQVTVSGWALDPDTSDPIPVHVYVGSTGTAFTASGNRPDVAAVFGAGAAHGFQATVTAPLGTSTVCVFAINTPTGPNPALGCRSITVTSTVNRPPIGSVDSFSVLANQVSVAGWALDPDTNDPVQLKLTVGSAETSVTADLPRPDVAAVYAQGAAHGFAASVAAPVGANKVCVVAVNRPNGTDTTLGCKVLTVTATTNTNPIGSVDAWEVAANQITVSGWALDPDTSTPIPVHVYVAGVGTAFSTNIARPDVAAAFGMGAVHGFSASVTAPVGTSMVCVYAINAPAGPNPAIGCRAVTVTSSTNTPPVGYVEQATSANRTITVSGWALDPDTASPIRVTLTGANLPTTTAVAAAERPDVAGFGRGSAHGFTVSVPAAAGTYSVCIAAGNVPQGTDPTLGCLSVTVT